MISEGGLSAIFERLIGHSGPISVAHYMAESNARYYASKDPFGEGGDFITAPEISQMFGELLGLCLAQTWLDQGAPTPFTLAELGPGRGTLMADVLRVPEIRGVGDRPATRAYLDRILSRPAFLQVKAEQIAQFEEADRARGSDGAG